MGIQSIGHRNLFISSSMNGLHLQRTVTQPKLRSFPIALASSGTQQLQWSIGCCGNPRWDKFTRVCFCVNRQDFQGSRKRSACSATRNGNQPVPEEDRPEDKSEFDSPGLSDAGQGFEFRNLDWRAYRARLVASEQVYKTEIVESETVTESSIALGPKWAHPIQAPEPGCVLVATEKVDGQQTFERTVVLLLRAGSDDPRDGPFGVILNRPLQRCIKDMKPTDPNLATIFADCALHFGGPYEASIFLLTTEKNVTTDLEEVIPGLCYGARNSLHHAAELVRSNLIQPQNFRFFLGFSGWESDQLKKEIALGYWYVAACSSNLITTASASSSGLWGEILQLMGGQYAALSRKSKEENL